MSKEQLAKDLGTAEAMRGGTLDLKQQQYSKK